MGTATHHKGLSESQAEHPKRRDWVPKLETVSPGRGLICRLARSISEIVIPVTTCHPAAKPPKQSGSAKFGDSKHLSSSYECTLAINLRALWLALLKGRLESAVSRTHTSILRKTCYGCSKKCLECTANLTSGILNRTAGLEASTVGADALNKSHIN